MNNKNKETFTRSDIESSLKKEFPNLTKQEISQAIDIILDAIIESVATDSIIASSIISIACDISCFVKLGNSFFKDDSISERVKVSLFLLFTQF